VDSFIPFLTKLSADVKKPADFSIKKHIVFTGLFGKPQGHVSGIREN